MIRDYPTPAQSYFLPDFFSSCQKPHSNPITGIKIIVK